jgi:polysaccharide deacetylase family protein (PEP-CTERM system associated)
MLNILTIDLEDYFQVHAFSDVIKYDDWNNYECRVERNTDRLLSILSSVRSPQHSQLSTQNSESNNSVLSPQHLPKATFFVLGWIAERYPDLVRRIKKEGHEVACHGYAHRLVYTQSRDEFRKDVKRAKSILENITGKEVIGYRAPSYSITNRSEWAFEVLLEEGFKYDSSIFPIRHDFYGMPEAPRFPFVVSLNGNSNVEFSMLNCELNAFQDSKLNIQNSQLNAQSSVLKANSPLNTENSKFIIEFPISTARLFGLNFPISGGGYFRLFPYSLIRKGLRSINEKEKRPFIFYIHPWEIDPNQPRVNGVTPRSKFRHYVNLNKTEDRLQRLLNDFNFSSVRQMLYLDNLITH